MKELLEICGALRTLEGEGCALATVIRVEGSSYRRPGARMLLKSDGRSWGMISGGCLEHDVMDHARRTWETGKTCVVRYDSTSADDVLFGTGLGCNGVIDVFIEPIHDEYRNRLRRAVETCERTRQRGGIATLVRDGGASKHAFLEQVGGWAGDTDLVRELNTAFRAIDPTGTETNLIDGRIFVQSLLPPIHLVIFGGWLDVVPLIRIGREVGFSVTVVDARARSSSRALFHEADAVLLCSGVDAIAQLQFDERTAVVLMAHHLERDQEALGALIEANPFYLGMLGPKGRQEKIVERLGSEGVVLPDQLRERIHGPAGLDLGVSTPEGIALAIVAEIQTTLTGRKGDMLGVTRPPLREKAANGDYLQPIWQEGAVA